jgi:hypothetical protein
MEGSISWGERDPHEAEALRFLVEAEAYGRQARLTGSKTFYAKALEYADKVIAYFPWSVIGHYLSAVAHLQALGDKNYATHQYQLLQTFKSEEANHLAKNLINEIEATPNMP